MKLTLNKREKAARARISFFAVPQTDTHRDFFHQAGALRAPAHPIIRKINNIFF